MIRRVACGLAALESRRCWSARTVLAALWDQCEVAVGRDALSWVLALGSSAAGVLIALRRPRNAIGWILLAAAVSVGEDSLARAYADHWVAGNGGPATLGKAAAV